MFILYSIHLLSLGLLARAVDPEQILLKSPSQDVNNINSKRVAIIGAGIAGASAAYRLQEYRCPSSALDITVYEAASQAGGRVKSVNVYDGAYGSQQVETGAHTFYSDNECLQTAIDEVGLRTKLKPHYPRQKSVGVWNGQSFILRGEKDLKSTTWRHLARFTWKYGLSPLRLRNLLGKQLPKLKEVCGAYQTLNRNIPEVLDNLGLKSALEQSAKDYLLNRSISSEFSRAVIQATARASFSHDLDDLNGLAALVAMSPAESDSLQTSTGGNRELIDRLLRLSRAQIKLNTRVSKISRSDSGRYHLTVKATDTPEGLSISEAVEYDAVIIATPLQGAGIDFDMAVHVASALTPYVGRHVTHFTSPESETLSPSFFHVSTTEEIPEKIYTTTSPDSTPDFFSIESSEASLGLDGCILKSENLYKIVSPAPIKDSIIAKLLGKSENSTLEDLGVRWVHRQPWRHAYPKFSSAALLNNIELADGLFYTGIADEVVSSLEMSCRMGRLAVDLLHYSKWATKIEQ